MEFLAVDLPQETADLEKRVQDLEDRASLIQEGPQAQRLKAE